MGGPAKFSPGMGVVQLAWKMTGSMDRDWNKYSVFCHVMKFDLVQVGEVTEDKQFSDLPGSQEPTGPFGQCLQVSSVRLMSYPSSKYNDSCLSTYPPALAHLIILAWT